MFDLFNPTGTDSFSLADMIHAEEAAERDRSNRKPYSKKCHREDRIEVLGGIKYAKAGGGRRRLSTVYSSNGVG